MARQKGTSDHQIYREAGRRKTGTEGDREQAKEELGGGWERMASEYPIASLRARPDC